MMSDELLQAPPSLVPPPLPPPLPRPKPRVWTPLVVGTAALGLMIVVSSILMIATLAATGGFDPQKPPTDERPYYDAVGGMVTHFWGISAMVLPGQFTMLFAALGAALLSPEKLRARLGYLRGHARWWVVPLILLGTFFTGVLGGVASNAFFPEDSLSLQMFVAMSRGPQGAGFIGTLLLLSVVPAVVEESLFRGYIQRRLLQRWHPAAAIGASTGFFTLAHFDPQHMLAIIPLGIWLGYLAWRTSTLWPGMLCHAAQNVFAILAARYGDPTERSITPEMIPTLVVMGLAFLGSVFFLQRTKISADFPQLLDGISSGKVT